jgi:hypothetical protein
LKDNRIEIVEVVKGEKQRSDFSSDEDWASYVRNRNYTESEPKFSQYQLEGEKENYKEVLVTMPSKTDQQLMIAELNEKYGNGKWTWRGKDKNITDKETERYINALKKADSQQFKSSHFDEPNILVHLRMNNRTSSDGKKVLFLEEVQSDWGQKGKKEGFKGEELDPANLTFKVTPDGTFNLYQLYDKSGNLVFELPASKSKGDNVFTKESLRQEFKGSQAIELMGKNTPSAPFVTDTNAWTKLGLKVALKEAVKQGEQMQRTAFEKLVDEKMDLVEARMKKLGKLEIKCP